jgi:ubiquinone biosynthesis protein COQ4
MDRLLSSHAFAKEFFTMSAPRAIDTRLHPIEALRAFRRLGQNPGDTSQIFAIFRALRGGSGIKAFKRFAASPSGAGILRRRPSLLAALSDRASLAQLRHGSLGRAYLAFMEEENLTADGLVEASRAPDWDTDVVPPEMDFFRKRMRDAHDLTHMLTGYGRDPLGELCLLTFMYRHTRNLGMLFVVMMSWPRIPKVARGAVKEAWRNGKKARWFPNLDFEALLPRDREDIRAELGIVTPALYHAFSR